MMGADPVRAPVTNITVRPADKFGGTVQEEIEPGVYVTRDEITGAVLSVQVASPRIVRVNGAIVWASGEQREQWATLDTRAHFPS
jgi:hypothetical protein